MLPGMRLRLRCGDADALQVVVAASRLRGDAFDAVRERFHDDFQRFVVFVKVFVVVPSVHAFIVTR